MATEPTMLRAAVKSDVPALVHLLRRSWLVTWAPELPFEAVQAFAAHDPAREHAEKTFASFTIAERASEVIGLFHVNGDVVENLHVDPAEWERGIGSLLLKEAERRIATYHPRAYLEVRAFNKRALNFYSRRGWIETRRYPGTECGASVENIEMMKAL